MYSQESLLNSFISPFNGPERLNQIVGVSLQWVNEWLTCLHQSYKSYINHKNTHPLCYPLTDQQNTSKLYVFACHLMYESKDI